MSDIQRPSMMLVKWQDCETLDGWHEVPTLLEFASQPRIIWTTGFLIDHDEKRIVLSSSWETTFGKIAGGWIIPKSQVLEIVEIQDQAKADGTLQKAIRELINTLRANCPHGNAVADCYDLPMYTGQYYD